MSAEYFFFLMIYFQFKEAAFQYIGVHSNTTAASGKSDHSMLILTDHADMSGNLKNLIKITPLRHA